MKLVLIGGGGHANSVINALPAGLEAEGYVDIAPSAAMDLPWLGDDDTFLASDEAARSQVLITMVSGRSCSLEPRRRLIEKYSDLQSPVVVASTAWVSPAATLGKGTVAMHHSLVNCNTRLGEHCVVNSGAIVEHDCIIGSNVFIGPGAVICGGVGIGDNTYIGAGAVIRPGVKICAGAMVSMGAAVFRRITVAGTYLGNPAKKIT